MALSNLSRDQAGAVMVEVAILAAFVVIAGVAVLLTVIVPEYTKSRGVDYVLDAFNSKLADSQSVQRLSIEGRQIKRTPADLENEAVRSMNDMYNLTRMEFCAAILEDGQPPIYLKRDRTVCAPASANLENDFTKSLDPLQDGEQLGISVYPDPVSFPGNEMYSRLRPSTDIANQGSLRVP